MNSGLKTHTHTKKIYIEKKKKITHNRKENLE